MSDKLKKFTHEENGVSNSFYEDADVRKEMDEFVEHCNKRISELVEYAFSSKKVVEMRNREKNLLISHKEEIVKSLLHVCDNDVKFIEIYIGSMPEDFNQGFVTVRLIRRNNLDFEKTYKIRHGYLTTGLVVFSLLDLLKKISSCFDFAPLINFEYFINNYDAKDPEMYKFVTEIFDMLPSTFTIKEIQWKEK